MNQNNQPSPSQLPEKKGSRSRPVNIGAFINEAYNSINFKNVDY